MTTLCRTHRETIKILWAIVCGVLASLFPNHVLADNPPRPQFYSITPTQVKAAKGEVRVSIFTSTSNCKQHPMNGATIDTPIPSFVTVKAGTTTFTDDGCFMNATLVFDDNVSTGTVILPVKDAAGKIENVSLDVVDVFRQPIPPGIAPEVDIMWSVVPDHIVKDSFGTSVGNGFYCIEVVIGNNTGYDLQIASVGFTLDASKSTLPVPIDDHLQDKYPSSSYLITRGTLEHGKDWSTRNLTVNIMRASGTVLTGFIPFFHLASHTANYTNGVNAFSNLFIPGFESVFPEETIRQLSRLDGQILRDSFVISNNTHRRTLVFFPKELVPATDPKSLVAVRTSLGNMVIVGDLIRHYERVRVSSNGTPEPTPVPTGGTPGQQTPAALAKIPSAQIPATLTAKNLASAGQTVEVAISGDYASANSITSETSGAIKATVETWDPQMKKLVAELEIPMGTTEGTYVFDVKDKNDTALGQFKIVIPKDE